MEIWLRQDGVEYGPYSLDDVRGFIKNGETSLDDDAWFDGSDDYLLVRDIPSIQVPTKKSPNKRERKTQKFRPSKTGVNAKRKPNHFFPQRKLSELFDIPEKQASEKPATERQKNYIRTYFWPRKINGVANLTSRQASSVIKQIKGLRKGLKVGGFSVGIFLLVAVTRLSPGIGLLILIGLGVGYGIYRLWKVISKKSKR
jgi:hypothetical protein